MPRTDGFLCYAHANGQSPSREFVVELQRHLRYIEPGHEHRLWSDQDIRSGEDWPNELRAALDRAAYAVVFVNIELIDSEFVREVELPALLKAAEDDGLLLVALRVGTCRLPDWLARIQFSNHEDPPLYAAKRPTRDRAYTAVAGRVEEHLRGGPASSQAVRLMAQTPGVSAEPARAMVGTSETASAPLADLAGALSRRFAADLDRLKACYLRGERAAALVELDTLIADEAWSVLDARLCGRLLRTAALYRLALDQIGEAEALAQRARTADQDGDYQTLDAQLALHRGGPAAALRLLEPPGSVQARHLRAALLIQTDDAAGALAALASDPELDAGRDPTQDSPAEPQASGGREAPAPDAPAGQQDAAETWRLRGLALLALKRLPEAAEAVAQARALAPDWLGVRAAAALIEFWRACTPAALDLTARPLWPMPFARGLVRVDTQARAGLAEAGQTFADIAASLPDGSDEQGHWLTWRLIALITTGASRDEATALARRLLSDERSIHIWPLLWAQFHGLDLDREALKRRLAEVPPEDPNAVPLRGLYLELRLEDGEAEQVLAELPDLGRLAVERGLAEVPRQWAVAALTAAGRLDEAERATAEVGDERLRLRLGLLIARERECAQPGSHKTVAAALFAADPGLDTLAEACDAHARATDWAFVAEHADALLAAVPTPGSLRLLVDASFNLGQYQRCLSALDDHRSVYPEGRLPPDLALLRVRCQRMLGETSEAAREARLLFDETPSVEHLVELLNAQLEAADAPGTRESLHRLLLIEPADGHLLLQGARIAEQYDRDLSARLWRRAAAHPTDQPEFVVQAVMLGERLGLSGEEVKPWFQRMQAQAVSGNGAVRMLDLSEMPDFLREQRESQRALLDKLWHGEAGLVMLPRGLLGPLPAVLHADPDHNRAGSDPLLQRPVLIRHGERPLGEWLRRREQRPRLILDLTALLTAHSLGLLDQVERAFGPLWLHRQWHLLLCSEIEHTNPVQPRRSAIHAQIGQLVSARGIALIDSVVPPTPDAMLTALVGEAEARNLEWARSNAARLMTYLPLHGPDIEHWQQVDPPPPWDDLLLGPRALLDGLLGEELIDPQSHEAALAAFPPEPEVNGLIPLPPRGAALLSSTTLLGQFAELNLLTVLSHRFRLHVTMQDWRRDQEDTENDGRRVALTRWIEGLIERVSAGLRDERYQVLPTAGPDRDDGEPEFGGLGELLSRPGGPGDLLWVDDRFVNGFPSTGTTPIIGIVEVLDLLCAHGAINRKQRFLWLNRLRASDYRFIPLDADEILHWLRQAHPQGNRLAVPIELGAIARYWAACLYQGDALQWAGNDRHRNGELPFFVASQSGITEVLTAIWSDDRLKKGLREQRADWLLDNLYVGVADVPHLGPAPTAARDLSLIGMDLAGLCFGAFQVVFEHVGRHKRANKARSSGHRQEAEGQESADRALASGETYLRWVCERLVAPRLRADPDSLAPTAAAMRSLILGSSGRDDDALSLIGSWLLRFLPVLPPQLRKELHKDQDLMQRLGLAEVVVQELDGLRFRAPEFWSACEAALRGLRPILHEADTGKAHSLERVSHPDDPRPNFRLADETGKTVREGYFEFSELLLDSRERRLQALRAHPHWWDGEPEGYEALERRLAVIEPAELRIRRLMKVVERSADAHYLAVADQWRRDRGMGVDRCFPPPLDAVLTWLRCGAEALTGALDTDALWHRLVVSIPPKRGLAEPLRRMARLPCLLPDAAHARIAALDEEQTADVLGTLAPDLTDPLGRLHLIDLLLGAAARWPAALGLAQALVAHLASARFDAEVKLLLALVDLGYRALGCEPGATSIPPSQRLLAAWAHAGRIAGILLAGPADPSTVAEQLRAWNPFPYRNLYGAGDEPMQDLAWPWHVHAADLRYAALGCVLVRHPNIAAGLDLSPMQERWQRLLAGEGDAHGEVHLLADPALLADGLHCLWGGDRSALLAPVLGAEMAAECAPSAFAARVDEALAQLDADPQERHAWRLLTVTVGSRRLPDAQAERLAAILERLDVDALIAADPRLQTPVLDLAIRHTKQPERIADIILGWAEGLDTAEQPGAGFQALFGEDPVGAFEERLMHWLRGLALGHPGDQDAEFARLLDEAILRSRTLAAYLRGPLQNIVRRLPYVPHRALRRTLLAARARVAPNETEPYRLFAPSTKLRGSRG